MTTETKVRTKPLTYDWTPQIAAKANRLKAKGLTYAQIEDRLGVSANIVRRFLGPDFGPEGPKENIIW